MLTLKIVGKQLLVLTLALGLMMAILSVFGMEAHAQNTSAAREGIGIAGGSAAGGEAELGSLVGTIIDVLSIVVGAVSVIMIIVGGFKYVVSAGESSGVQSAKQTIMYAIVGLVVVIFARIIVTFVVDRVDGTATPAAGGTPTTP